MAGVIVHPHAPPAPRQLQGKTVRLSEDTVDALLDRLANDDDFRARFQRNPREATQSLGTNDAAADVLPEAPIASLADKGTFHRARHAVRKQLLEAQGPFNPITLEIPQR